MAACLPFVVGVVSSFINCAGALLPSNPLENSCCLLQAKVIIAFVFWMEYGGVSGPANFGTLMSKFVLRLGRTCTVMSGIASLPLCAPLLTKLG
jgi:hypothetical protein